MKRQGSNLREKVKLKRCKNNINLPPLDILKHIFSYLDTKTLFIVGSVCREWRNVSLHKFLWTKFRNMHRGYIGSRQDFIDMCREEIPIHVFDFSYLRVFRFKVSAQTHLYKLLIDVQCMLPNYDIMHGFGFALDNKILQIDKTIYENELEAESNLLLTVAENSPILSQLQELKGVCIKNVDGCYILKRYIQFI